MQSLRHELVISALNTETDKDFPFSASLFFAATNLLFRSREGDQAVLALKVQLVGQLPARVVELCSQVR